MRKFEGGHFPRPGDFLRYCLLITMMKIIYLGLKGVNCEYKTYEI